MPFWIEKKRKGKEKEKKRTEKEKKRKEKEKKWKRKSKKKTFNKIPINFIEKSYNFQDNSQELPFISKIYK